VVKIKRTNNDLQYTTQKLMIEQREPHYKPGVNSCAPEGWSVRAPLVEPVVLVLLQIR
jgi:hypothetical protein